MSTVDEAKGEQQTPSLKDGNGHSEAHRAGPATTAGPFAKSELKFFGAFWLVLVAWLILFMVGTWVPADIYLHAVLYGESKVQWLNVPSTWLGMAWCAFMAFISWSLTNVALLCGLSAAIGEFFRVWWLSTGKPDLRQASARAFVVFLGMLSGQLIFLGNVTGAPDAGTVSTAMTQGQYVRIAGTASLLCFLCSAHPQLILTVMDRIEAALTGGKDSRTH